MHVNTLYFHGGEISLTLEMREKKALLPCASRDNIKTGFQAFDQAQVQDTLQHRAHFSWPKVTPGWEEPSVFSEQSREAK